MLSTVTRELLYSRIALGQIVDADVIELRERHRALDAVLQLADVARPGVREQLLGGVALDARLTLCGDRGEALQEVLREKQDVAPARAERRHVNAHDVDPVEEVFAEALLLDLGLEVAVGRGDDAGVEGLSSSPPTGRTVRSCSARSSLACIPSGISPISSRKSVPPRGLHEEARARRRARR